MTATSYDWIGHHARLRPDKVAMRDAVTGHEETYAEMDERVDQLCAVVHGKFGVGTGDRLALHAQNDLRIFEVQFACWRLGAVFVPLNWRMAPPELAFLVSDCTPTVLVHEDGFADVAVPAEAGRIPHRLCWGGQSHGTVPYEEALAAAGNPFPRPHNTHDTLLTSCTRPARRGGPRGR